MEDKEDLTSRIRSCIKQDNFQEALDLSRAHSQEKGNQPLKYFVGLSHKLLGHLDVALNVFEDFEEEQYKNIDSELKKELLLNMADIYFTKQLFAKSGEYLQRLIDMDAYEDQKINQEIFNKCIESYANSENYIQIQKLGQKGVRKYPDDAFIHIQFAKALQIKKNYQEVIKLLEQFTQRINNPEAKILLADTYFSANMLKEAEKLNQLIIVTHPDYKLDATINLAKIKFSFLEYSEALKLCKQGFKVNPDSAGCYYYQGLSLYLQGELQEAIPSLEMACMLDNQQNYKYHLSLVMAYIEKGYLTQDQEHFLTAGSYLKRDEEEAIQKQTGTCLRENPLFQYVESLILRLTQTPKKFQDHWTQMFHISPQNLTPLSRHPSQDVYDRIDEDTQNLLCLIPQINIFAYSKPINSKYELEIEYQKSLLLFQILKNASIPSFRLKKQKYIELTQLIRNFNKYQEICSEEYQTRDSQQGFQNSSYQSQIYDQSIALHLSNLGSMNNQDLKQKKDKAAEEFNSKFMEITTSIIEFAFSYFQNGFKIDQKVSSYSANQLVPIILLSTIELEEQKKIGDLTIDDLNLPLKARRIVDLSTIGGGFLFKDSLQAALQQLDQQKFKSKISKKDPLKKEIENLNAYKIKEDLFAFKSAPDALAYEYAYKFFTSLLIDNQPQVKYYSYNLYYQQTFSRDEQITILNEIFKSIDTYSHKCMRESFIRSQNVDSEKCCSIF